MATIGSTAASLKNRAKGWIGTSYLDQFKKSHDAYMAAVALFEADRNAAISSLPTTRDVGTGDLTAVNDVISKLGAAKSKDEIIAIIRAFKQDLITARGPAAPLPREIDRGLDLLAGDTNTPTLKAAVTAALDGYTPPTPPPITTTFTNRERAVNAWRALRTPATPPVAPPSGWGWNRLRHTFGRVRAAIGRAWTAGATKTTTTTPPPVTGGDDEKLRDFIKDHLSGALFTTKDAAETHFTAPGVPQKNDLEVRATRAFIEHGLYGVPRVYTKFHKRKVDKMVDIYDGFETLRSLPEWNHIKPDMTKVDSTQSDCNISDIFTGLKAYVSKGGAKLVFENRDAAGAVTKKIVATPSRIRFSGDMTDQEIMAMLERAASAWHKNGMRITLDSNEKELGHKIVAALDALSAQGGGIKYQNYKIRFKRNFWLELATAGIARGPTFHGAAFEVGKRRKPRLINRNAKHMAGVNSFAAPMAALAGDAHRHVLQLSGARPAATITP